MAKALNYVKPNDDCIDKRTQWGRYLQKNEFTIFVNDFGILRRLETMRKEYELQTNKSDRASE